MIPDHLIDRAAAVHAEHIGSRAQADGFFMPIKRGQLPLPRVAIEAMERALAAVAADIWEDGYDAGSDDERAHHLGVSLIDINQHTPNPYKRNETA